MKIPNIKVKQLGPNNFLVHTDEGVFLQSYGSIIAFHDHSWNVTLDENLWDYSTTTSKYRNQFLGETTATTRKHIKNGTHKLANLNGK